MRYHTFSIINCLEVVILVLRYWEATSRHGTCNMVVWTDTHTYEATRILSKSRYEPRLRATPRKRIVYEPRALSSASKQEPLALPPTHHPTRPPPARPAPAVGVATATSPHDLTATTSHSFPATPLPSDAASAICPGLYAYWRIRYRPHADRGPYTYQCMSQ